ncbi:MAG TPA: OFA family MFS transporter [Firmicutes bacterium]|nr:OFA family MFS transporter [Bacillota bacterium]
MGNNYARKGWIVAFSATGITLAAGLVYVWSVISNGLIQHYKWTSMQASLPYTTLTVAFVISMMVFGKIQDKKGPRLCNVLSGIFIGSGMVLSGLVRTPWVMIITFGILTGAGIGITNIATAPALKWFPPEKKGLISGIVVCGAGLAPIIYSPLANYLINAVGIARTFISIGIVVCCVIIFLARLIDNPPPGMGQATGRGEQAAGNAPDLTSAEMLKTADFYKLWLILALSAAAGLMVFAHATTIARVQAHWDSGYLLVILLAVFNAAGRLGGGTLSDLIGRTHLLRIIFLLQIINLLLFPRFASVPLLAAGMAVTGFYYGATFSVFPALAADFFGLKNFGANYGLIFTAWGVSGLIGPTIAAGTFDATGNFNLSYFISAALLLVVFAVTFTLRETVTGAIPVAGKKAHSQLGK